MYCFLLLFLLLIYNPVQAEVIIKSSIDGNSWSRQLSIYPRSSQKIVLKVDQREKASIKWFQIIPDISKIYKNANHPWEPNPYKWVGLAKIDYFKEELKQFRNQWMIRPKFQNKSFASPFFHQRLGSFWIQAQIESNHKKISSPGIEDSDHRGLSPKVFRISIRAADGFIGYLTSFFNVPALFGSVPYQSNNHIGADCADILIAAYGKWKNIKIKKNYNVAMLVNKFKKVQEFDIKMGKPSQKLKWQKDLRPGDFIAVRYYANRQYQHIGALYQDANHNKILDQNDLVIHAGPMPLQISALEQGGFDGHVVILRP